MSEKTQSKKALTNTDSLQVAFYSWIDRILKQRAIIFGFFGILLGVYAVILAASYFRDHRADGRRNELAAIDAQFAKENDSLDPKRDELRKKIEALAPKPGADGKTPEMDPAMKAQIEALRSESEMLRANHDGSAAAYKKFYEENTGNPEGWYAGNRYGEYLEEKGQKDEVKKWYEDLLVKSANSPFYQTKLKLTLAALAEDRKDYDAALKLIDELNNAADKELKPVLLLTKARILASQNKVDDSKATIDLLLKDHSESQEAEKARGMKALL